LRACGLLQEAAQRAVSRSAFRSAEGILAHARELAGDDWMAWMKVDDLLLDVHSQAGKTERILELGYGLIDVYQGRYRGAVAATRLAELHLRIARGIAPAGDWTRVSSELTEARRLAEQAGDEALLVRIDALGAQAALALDDSERAVALAAAAERAAELLGMGEALCEALDVQGRAASREGEGGRAVALFKRCEEAAELYGRPLWRVKALLELGTVDNLANAELGRLAEARVLAGQTGAVSALAASELQLAWAYLGRAELGAADEAIARCLDVSRPHRLGGLLPSALAAKCMLHALRDEPELLERVAAEALEQDRDPTVEARVIGNGWVVLRLARGDDPAALELLDRVVQLAPHATDWTVSWLHGLRILLHTVENSGEQSIPAPTHANPLTAAYFAYARAVTLGRKGKREDALAAMAEADAAMAPGWRRAHARLVVARDAFEVGWGDPTRWMRESLAFLESVPLPHFAGASKSALRRAGAPVPRRGRGESRRIFVTNAPTFLAEMRDPEQVRIDLEGLSGFPHPTLLTNGDNSRPEFPAVVAKLAETIPGAERRTLVGAAHVPHLTHPADYAGLTLEFLSRVA
jgi:pimeloyl-ACP methyl ester carboxylesterase